MSNRKRKPPSKPSNAYLISFGDTMTAMLAFFIVLNTLAKEQTGANLHAGTGSFMTAVRSMGLPGVFTTESSRQVSQQNEVTPLYIVDDPENPSPGKGTGPDEENGLRVIDPQAEQLQRLIVEMEQQFHVESHSESAHQVAFDLFERLGKAPDMLPGDAKKVLARSMAIISRPNYRIVIDVWSPTPSLTALNRTTNNARQIKQEIQRDFRSFKRPGMLQATARIWPYSNERRPVMTINVIKTSTGLDNP